MDISVLCSDPRHPIQPRISSWADRQRAQHRVTIANRFEQLPGGDLLFLVACSEVLDATQRSRYRSVLVLHASDLPEGRGWSPQVWQILEGRNEIVMTLLEADDKVDTGAIWAQQRVRLEDHELADEINDKLFAAQLALMDQ